MGEYRGLVDSVDKDGVRASSTKGQARVLVRGSDHPMFEGQVVSDISEFTTMMHEIGHGLAMERTDREPSVGSRQADNPLTSARKALESVKVGSFEDFILDAVENYQDQTEVLREIINLQENIDVQVAKRPEFGTTGVRELREVSEYIKANPVLKARFALGN